MHAPSRPPVAHASTRTRNILLVAAGATSVIPVMTYAATGFSFVCLVAVVLYFQRLGDRRLWLPLGAASLGSIAYVTSALVNGTSLLAPGVPSFPACGLYFCGIVLLARSIRETVSILAGAALGTIAFYLVFGTALTESELFANLWKYGWAPSVTVLILVCLTRGDKARPWWGCAALLAMTVVSVGLNFRSHSLLCLVAAVFVATDRIRVRATPVTAKIITGLVLAVAGSVALRLAAGAGWLGASLTEKIESQAGDHVPTILAGRSESPLSLTAIAAKPVLGWGSADNISPEVFERAYQLALKIGFDSSYPFEYAWRLPGGAVSLHSILLGSTAEAGFLGALLPLYLIGVCVVLIRLAPANPVWATLLTYLGVQGIWDLLFSPWSYNLPVVYAAETALAVAILVARNHGRAASAARVIRGGPGEDGRDGQRHHPDDRAIVPAFGGALGSGSDGGSPRDPGGGRHHRSGPDGNGRSAGDRHPHRFWARTGPGAPARGGESVGRHRGAS